MTQTAASTLYQELLVTHERYLQEGRGKSPEAAYIKEVYQTTKRTHVAELRRRGLPTNRSAWWNGAQEEQRRLARSHPPGDERDLAETQEDVIYGGAP